MNGALVLSTVTVWLQLVLSPQPSAICHVSVIRLEQAPLVDRPVGVTNRLVTVPAVVMIGLVQQVEAIGGSKLQALPHGTVLLGGHCTCRQFVAQLAPGCTVTVKVQLLLRPQKSVTEQFTMVVVLGAKKEPDGGVQTTVQPEQPVSVTVGA